MPPIRKAVNRNPGKKVNVSSRRVGKTTVTRAKGPGLKSTSVERKGKGLVYSKRTVVDKELGTKKLTGACAEPGNSKQWFD